MLTFRSKVSPASVCSVSNGSWSWARYGTSAGIVEDVLYARDGSARENMRGEEGTLGPGDSSSCHVRAPVCAASAGAFTGAAGGQAPQGTQSPCCHQESSVPRINSPGRVQPQHLPSSCTSPMSPTDEAAPGTLAALSCLKMPAPMPGVVPLMALRRLCPAHEWGGVWRESGPCGFEGPLPQP